MARFDSLRRWLETNARDLSLDAENPARFTWELEQLRGSWARTADEEARLTETWVFIERHPRIHARAIAEGAATGDVDAGRAPDTSGAAPYAGSTLPVHVPKPAPTQGDLMLSLATLLLIAGVVTLAIVAALGGVDNVSHLVAGLAALAGVLLGYHLGRRARG